MINTLLKQSRILFNFLHPLRAGSFKVCRDLVMNKSGIEFGGPSSIFSSNGMLPLYSIVKSLDNCNYSSRTIWDGDIQPGYSFKYFQDNTGYQYVLDTTDFKEIQSEKYDFVLGSHIIEHFANPIKALFEWKRILKTDGILIVVIPHKDGTFDNRRPVTKLSHLIDDYKINTGEDDLTHIEEILKLHDLNSDKDAGSVQNFKERSLKNYENRCMHHHVFNTQLAANLINYIGLQIIKVEPVLPCHIIVTAKKSLKFDNEELLNTLEKGDFRSYFKSDKIKLSET